MSFPRRGEIYLVTFALYSGRLVKRVDVLDPVTLQRVNEAIKISLGLLR